MWERTEADILNALPDSLLEGHVWKGSKCQPQQIHVHMSSSAQHVTESSLHDAQLCASWTETRTFRGRCVLGVKQREVEHEITSVYHPHPLLASASLPVRLGGFGRHWRCAGLIHEADKSGACGLRRRVFLDIMHACMHWWLGAPPDSSSSHLLPVRNDLDSPGCWMCLHTRNTNDIVSQRGALAATRRDALSVTKAPIHLPLGWNALQRLRSPAVLWLHPWWC